VSEGLEAGGFKSAADVQVEVRTSTRRRKPRPRSQRGRASLDAVVTIFGQASQAAREAAPGHSVVVNLRSAGRVGLTVPESVVSGAAQVIR